MVFVMQLVCMTDNALAMYLNDGAKEILPGVYVNPNDGACVVGVAANGNILIDTSITNARNCVAYTQSADAGHVANLRTMTTSAACTRTGDAGNATIDGTHYKHTWVTTNTCVNAASPTVAISLEGLDRTLAMCQSKGGTTLSTAGTCVANGWVYMNRKIDGTLPITGTAIPGTTLITTTAAQFTDNLGFCYATMRMTSGTYNSSTTCPSYHNSATGNAAEWPACLSSATGCQTQASYDAGLGWAWDATNNRCNYDYGVKGILNADLTNTNNGRPTLPNCTGAGTLLGSAGNCVDLTGITNQGECLSVGGSWDNWLIKDAGRTTKTNVDAGYAGMPANSTIVKLDATTSIKDGGGNFRSGTGAVCLKCHTDQSRAYMERNKPGFVETPHQKAGDTPGLWQSHFTYDGSDWKLKGVQCTMCHSTARPAQDDLIQVAPAGTVGTPAAGDPISATGHNKTEYGSFVTDVCFTCHGHFPSSNAASVIPVSGGDFAPTGKGLAPIANQFLNSPHAKYTGTTSAKVDIGNKTNYASTFAGYICRSSNSIGTGSILTTAYINGEVVKIPFLDSTINTICSNAGDGTANSGAAGFWLRDGETTLAPPPAPATSDQGSCMTCHDVHWDFDSTLPGAEPLRRECTTCHMNPGVSATGAPQVLTDAFNHPTGPGTPLEHFAEHPYSACETCHMPASSDTGSRMHLWRINTDSNYETMGATQANTSASGNYANAAWVAISRSCGQCHQSGGVAYAFTFAQLAGAAKSMHSGGSSTNADCLLCHASGVGGAPVITPGVNHHGLQSDSNPFSCTACHTYGHNSPLPDTSNATCLNCHAIVQSGPGKNHHDGTCTFCHHTDGSFSGAPAAGVIIGQETDCGLCHGANVTQAAIQHPTSPVALTCQNCHTAGGFKPNFASACNPCHGGSAGPSGVVPPAPFLKMSRLVKAAAAIHKNFAPVASMTVLPLGGLSVQITDTSTDANGNLATIIISWGDGTSVTIAPGDTTPVHTYTKAGSKKITLTAIDAKGLQSKIKTSVTVSN